MVISVKPDPAHPRGGYAELTLSEGEISGETTEVSVFDNYSERYLGEAGWQPTKALFGPYAIRRSEGTAYLVIGPEIVNQIEEYANVRLGVGGLQADVSWPDDVVPAPGAPRIGGILNAAGHSEVQTPPQPTSNLVEETASEPEPAPAPPQQEAAPRSSSGKFIWVALAALLFAGAAGAAYWYMERAEPVISPTAAVSEPVTSKPCSPAELQGLPSFDEQLSELQTCGKQVSADTALGLVETAAAAGDPEALLLFGTVYDAMVNTPVIEDEIGFTFADTPATAAEYYARAEAAGSEVAVERLEALCERMATMTDTLTAGARADYCGE